jgi:hypothetical protein
MPTYQVSDNPYYRPAQGKNWLADRLIAAMQSFSAPKEGPYGPKAGFGSALLGNDVNRMNQSAILRNQDVAAGAEPFRQEVAAEEEAQGRALENTAAIAAERNQTLGDIARENQKAVNQRAFMERMQSRQLAEDKANQERHLTQLKMAQEFADKNRERMEARPLNEARQGLLQAQTQKALMPPLVPYGGISAATYDPTTGWREFNPPRPGASGPVQLPPEAMKYINFGDGGDDQDGDMEAVTNQLLGMDQFLNEAEKEKQYPTGITY